MALFGYLPKLERCLELAFGAHFHKNIPYLIFYQLTKFNVVYFFLLKISNKMSY